MHIEAAKVSELTGVSRAAITKIFDKLRKLIALKRQEKSPLSSDEVELDKSYLGERVAVQSKWRSSR